MTTATAVPARGRRPWHEALELGQERELWVHAATWPELVAQAGRAVGEQLLRGAPAVPSGRWRELDVQATRRASMLTQWLNELLFRAEVEWWVPVDFAAVRATDTGISARIRGVRPSEPPAALKVAAPDRVRVREVPGGLEAKIMLELENGGRAVQSQPTPRSVTYPRKREKAMKKQATAVQRALEGTHLRLVSSDRIFDRMKETFDAIARRAFEIFESNGRRLGRDLDDWFQAERELLHPLHLEVSETDGAFTVEVEVPGFTEKDVEINLAPRRLTISGTRESVEERKKGKTVYSERGSSRIFRVVGLPADVDTASAAISATCDKGILTITLPKLAKPETRQIKVEAKSAHA